ncbi:hypothetical protein D3C72_1399270 [compost metagenome]
MNWNYRAMQSLGSLTSMTEILSDSLKSGAKIPCDNLDKLRSAYASAFNDLADGGSGMFLTREHGTEYYWQLHTRIMAMRDFLCTQPGYEDEIVRHIYVEKFKKAWGADTELTAAQYFNRAMNDGASAPNRFPLVTLKIKKYTSPAELPEDLDFAVKDIEALDEILREQWQMKFNF